MSDQQRADVETTLRYFQFPLILLADVHKDFREGMQKIVDYAIVDFALKQQFDLFDVARELLYSYGRDNKNMYSEAKKLFGVFLNKHKDKFDPEHYNIFLIDGKPDDETIQKLTDLIIIDADLKNAAIINKQLRNAKVFLSVDCDINWSYKKYKEQNMIIVEHEQANGNDPRPTIQTDMFWDLLSEGADPDLFTAYIAIRSIEGRGEYAKTNKNTIAGRMAGAKKQSMLDDPGFETRHIYDKYTNRYHFDKLLRQLQERGLVKSHLSQKGWRHSYCSTKLDAVKLGEAVARNKNKNKVTEGRKKSLDAYYNYIRQQELQHN